MILFVRQHQLVVRVRRPGAPVGEGRENEESGDGGTDLAEVTRLADKAYERIQEAAQHELHRDPYRPELAESILDRVPDDLEDLMREVVLSFAEITDLKVDEHRGGWGHVNVDHIATIREARKTTEPDPVAAASAAEMAGADQITVHLREDRRHIQNRDVRLIREVVSTALNLEMAATAEMTVLRLTSHLSATPPSSRSA